MRVVIEVAHILIGLVAAVLIAWAAAWSYPRATDDIWLVAFACMAAVVLMGIGPVRRAYAPDRAKLDPESGDTVNG
ncbi:hypothetical protein CVN68_09950 [Sphingomonas psychrotolerans]|uniref:Uncharacterized protein n=1 Tax=Sphingomonas psychrotolerans TaxID=1327635 RepID=A0A2K8MKZ8_9SPHN|nr:hypothetical protein CVN68_09950 [Sphingomonas psychrotolerans]